MCSKLHQTMLWKVYQSKSPTNDRLEWIEQAYRTAVLWLKQVPCIFPNYTLHDEEHVLNVMTAIAGILGNQINELSLGECELLILASAFHDIGMVYDEKGKKIAIDNRQKCRGFLLKNAPDYIGAAFNEWPIDMQQNYLRSLHPFRLPEILVDQKWNFDNRPREIVPKEILIAVCRSHGEDILYLKNDRSLNYQATNNVDPLFCALLLRLGDILDFDGSRAPQILFNFAQGNLKSEDEYRKHLASNGFVYPKIPSDNQLLYSAECYEPWVEHNIRNYLNWVDQELILCNDIKRLCKKDWQRCFPFPSSVSRTQISRIGYDSDEFSLTMDQEQILTLLTGENLYKNNDVFIRELLQNSIDATLMRKKMDPRFDLDSDGAAIYLWEGLDRNGNLIFRIDDHGIGMTRGMLKRYFLKVGNSYYNSEEMKRDLRRHNCMEDYHANSRFGIGFLSCFLCSTSAEISTLYFDEHKCREEYEQEVISDNGYGLRLEITGLQGYYTLRNQALDHVITEHLPCPQEWENSLFQCFDSGGYRYVPGTSIVLKIDPGKLGNCNIKKSIESYLCGMKMPVYFNGERIGKTYSEIIEIANKLEGEVIYELTAEEKKEFDNSFQKIEGNYPKISVTTMILDKTYSEILPGLSGVIIKYKVYFDTPPKWLTLDQTYTITASTSPYLDENRVLYLRRENIKSGSNSYELSWESFNKEFGVEAVSVLNEKFKEYKACPSTSDEIGKAWEPFAEKLDINDAWRAFVDKEYENRKPLILSMSAVPTLSRITQNSKCYSGVCAYQSIMCGEYFHEYLLFDIDALFYLEDEMRPSQDVGRTSITALPLEAELAICGIMVNLGYNNLRLISDSPSLVELTPKWREIRSSNLGHWLVSSLEPYVNKVMEDLVNPINKKSVFTINQRYQGGFSSIFSFFMALFQDKYKIKVSYELGQSFQLEEQNVDDFNEAYDCFPPMMFCEAASEESRKFLCCSYARYRRGITVDHPFSKWAIKNAGVLERYFPRQFSQMNYCLKNSDATEIIEKMNSMRDQLSHLRGAHHISITDFPILSEKDFWNPVFEEKSN